MELEKLGRLIERFEDHTLPKEAWTHQAHFMMALWYCINHPLPLAVGKIRNGIKTYNLSVGGENTDTAGYHETITLFYTTAVANYLVITGITALTDQHITTFLQQPFLEKDYTARFYSREVLMSKEARSTWIPPDRKPDHRQLHVSSGSSW